jgi:5-methylcytosine-specific restriction endonuclease McrA
VKLGLAGLSLKQTLPHFCEVANIKGSRGPRKVSAKSLPQLKRVFWDVVSKWIKQRDSDENGYSSCISCGKSLSNHTVDCQAGHFVPKGQGGSHHLGLPLHPTEISNEIIAPFGYDRATLCEANINIQCCRCNMQQGNWVGYEAGFKEKYGTDMLEALKFDANRSVVLKRSKSDYIMAIGYYKGMLD